MTLSQYVEHALPLPRITIQAEISTSLKWPRPNELLLAIGQTVYISGALIAIEDAQPVVFLDNLVVLNV